MCASHLFVCALTIMNGMSDLHFCEITPEELDALSCETPYSSFIQSAAMARAQSRGRQTFCFGVAEEGKLVAAALVVCHCERKFFKVAHINQGPVIDLERKDLVVFFFSQLREALAKRGVTYCLITPNVEVVLRDLDGEIVAGGFDHADQLANLKAAGLEYLGPDNSLINGVGRWMFVKDFQGITSQKDFFKSVDRSVRRQYRTAEELRVQIVELSSENMEPFFDVLNHTGERRGFETRDDFLIALKEEFGDQCHVLLAQLNVQEGIEILEAEIHQLNTEIARVKKQCEKQDSDGLRRRLEVLAEQIPPTEDRVRVLRDLLTDGVEIANLAAGIFFEHGNEYTHFMGGTYEKFMHVNLNGNNFLATSQMLRLVGSENLERYNFYGTFGKFSGSEDEGVYRFKRRFGGRVMEQPGNYRLVVSPLRMKAFACVGRLAGKS